MAKPALAVLLSIGVGCESGTVAAQSIAVPSPYFGLHVKRPSTPWPDLPIGSIRLWDTGTGWAQIERRQNEFDWTTFDRWLEVAARRRVEVLYTFGRTPQWAAASPKLEPCAYGPGHCSPPGD